MNIIYFEYTKHNVLDLLLNNDAIIFFCGNFYNAYYDESLIYYFYLFP